MLTQQRTDKRKIDCALVCCSFSNRVLVVAESRALKSWPRTLVAHRFLFIAHVMGVLGGSGAGALGDKLTLNDTL